MWEIYQRDIKKLSKGYEEGRKYVDKCQTVLKNVKNISKKINKRQIKSNNLEICQKDVKKTFMRLKGINRLSKWCQEAETKERRRKYDDELRLKKSSFLNGK